jgi:hypothetical protein
MDTLLDKEYGKLEYDTEKHFLKLTLIGNISDEDYKYIWDFSLEEARKAKCGNVLLDQRQVGFVKMRSRAWLILNWMPRSKEITGEIEQKLAILPSKHIAHKSGLTYLLDSFKKLLRHGFVFFDNEEEAILWLSSTKNENKKEQEDENQV